MRLIWLTHVAVVLTAALTFWAVSVPGWYFGPTVGAVLLWLAIGCAWLISLLVGALWKRSWLLRPWSWGHVAAAPALAAATFVLVVVGAPLEVRYRLSKPEMNRVARDVMHSRGPNRPAITEIGLFDVDRVERIPGGVRFVVRGTGFLSVAGFAYLPSHEPAVLAEEYYRHLDGPWYVWQESW